MLCCPGYEGGRDGVVVTRTRACQEENARTRCHVRHLWFFSTETAVNTSLCGTDGCVCILHVRARYPWGNIKIKSSWSAMILHIKMHFESWFWRICSKTEAWLFYAVQKIVKLCPITLPPLSSFMVQVWISVRRVHFHADFTAWRSPKVPSRRRILRYILLWGLSPFNCA